MVFGGGIRYVKAAMKCINDLPIHKIDLASYQKLHV